MPSVKIVVVGDSNVGKTHMLWTAIRGYFSADYCPAVFDVHRLPKWQPQWSMALSTIVMPCNDSGYHSVEEASAYGLVSYDWSNAKQLWCNAKPMDDGEWLVTQAEMVRNASNTTRIGVYRNSIKALNWFSEVREKLDDPAYSGWFIKFKDYRGPA